MERSDSAFDAWLQNANDHLIEEIDTTTDVEGELLRLRHSATDLVVFAERKRHPKAKLIATSATATAPKLWNVIWSDDQTEFSAQPTRLTVAAYHRSENVDAATKLRRQAMAAAQSGRTEEAIKLLNTALRALPETSNEPSTVAARIRIMCTLAVAMVESKYVPAGLEHIRAASRLAESLPKGPERSALYGLIAHQHAVLLLWRGGAVEALSLLDRAIPLLDRSEGTTADDRSLLAGAILNRGVTYLELGRHGRAEQEMRRCISLSETARLPVLRTKAQACLGEIALAVGDVPGSLRHYTAAERASYTVAPWLLPRLRVGMAKALLAAGLAEEAIQRLDQAVVVLRAKGTSHDLAEAELLRADAALLTGDVSLARTHAGRAQRRFVKCGSHGWAEVAALTRLQIETVAALDGRPNRASAAKAAELSKRLAAIGLTDESAKATMLAVRLLVRRGDVSTARAMLRQVPPSNRVVPIDHRILLRLCRAELALVGGDRKHALAEARAGLMELTRIRDRISGLDLPCGTVHHGRELGRLAIQVASIGATTSADARRLFTWQERVHTQVYRYEPPPKLENATLAVRRYESFGLVHAARQARLDGRSADELEQSGLALLHELRQSLESVERWGIPGPMRSPREIAERLGRRALVTFLNLPENNDEVAAIVVRDRRFHLVRLDGAAVMETVRQLYADFDVLAPSGLPEKLALTVSESAARRLSRLDKLLTPIVDMLDGRDVVVVPSGFLCSVPWGSIPFLQGQSVTVSPSASAWVNATENRNHRRRKPTQRTVLVTGPGVPEKHVELLRLREIHPQAVVLDGDEATVDNVLSMMDGAHLVHLAVRGSHEPHNALFSRLELVDGPLFAHDLARLRVPPTRVVLAAFEMAVNHPHSDMEPFGFAEALLIRGTRTVIGAVNRVGVHAAVAAMEDLHRRLADETAPAIAVSKMVVCDPLRRPYICLGSD